MGRKTLSDYACGKGSSSLCEGRAGIELAPMRAGGPPLRVCIHCFVEYCFASSAPELQAWKNMVRHSLVRRAQSGEVDAQRALFRIETLEREAIQ